MHSRSLLVDRPPFLLTYVHFHVLVPEMNTAFQMDDASFKDKYGFDKPTKGAPIVTSCHIGGRANKAKQGLEEQGYTDVKVYSGSFTDWKASGGEIENVSLQ